VERGPARLDNQPESFCSAAGYLPFRFDAVAGRARISGQVKIDIPRILLHLRWKESAAASAERASRDRGAGRDSGARRLPDGRDIRRTIDSGNAGAAACEAVRRTPAIAQDAAAIGNGQVSRFSASASTKTARPRTGKIRPPESVETPQNNRARKNALDSAPPHVDHEGLRISDSVAPSAHRAEIDSFRRESKQVAASFLEYSARPRCDFE